MISFIRRNPVYSRHSKRLLDPATYFYVDFESKTRSLPVHEHPSILTYALTCDTDFEGFIYRLSNAGYTTLATFTDFQDFQDRYPEYFI
jgi:hypothetical protein